MINIHNHFVYYNMYVSNHVFCFNKVYKSGYGITTWLWGYISPNNRGEGDFGLPGIHSSCDCLRDRLYIPNHLLGEGIVILPIKQRVYESRTVVEKGSWVSYAGDLNPERRELEINPLIPIRLNRAIYGHRANLPERSSIYPSGSWALKV